MRKTLTLAAACMMMLASCVDKDLYKPAPEEITEELQKEIDANVEQVFGVVFYADHDWSMTTQGKVTITANADLDNIQKVMILTHSPFGAGDGNDATILNEADAKFGESVELYYDAPSNLTRLYAACVADNGQCYIKSFSIGQESVSFASATRSMPASILAKVAALPANPTLARTEESYAHKRGYAGFENDALYLMADADEPAQIMALDEFGYDEEATQDLRDIIFTYLPNKVSNIEKIRSSAYYNANSYPLTTGEDPIILEPIYKNDGGYHEVEKCHLYYYYFKDSDLVGKSEAEQVQFFKDLPKFKAIEVMRSVKAEGVSKGMPDDLLRKNTAYTLIYWGDYSDGSKPAMGTVGTYQFPDGYRVGFMLRNAGKEVHQGELYCDGRLNGEVNKWGHLASAKLGETDARMAWLYANNKFFLCCESGTDRDFNDLVIEIEGGIDPLIAIPEVEANAYSYCFEDTRLGDYDLNDVVIRAKRINQTRVEYSIVACGAYDELSVCNINAGVITDDKEIHTLFGQQGKVFINTEAGAPTFAPVTVQKTVAKTFSFGDTETQPYLYNRTTGIIVRIAKKGEDPHGIMVPSDFKYPLERVCIKDAYPEFNNWGQNAINSTDWYKTWEESKVYNN